MIQTKYDWREYGKYIDDSGLGKTKLENPLFIPVPAKESIYIMVKDTVYTPYFRSSTMLKIPKGVKELSKKKKFVIFSEKRLIGCEDIVYPPFYHQPRIDCYAWLVAENIETRYVWYKKHNTAPGFKDAAFAFLICLKEMLSGPTNIEELGGDLYRILLNGSLGTNSSQTYQVESLMEICEEREDSPFFSYKVDKFLREVCA